MARDVKKTTNGNTKTSARHYLTRPSNQDCMSQDKEQDQDTKPGDQDKAKTVCLKTALTVLFNVYNVTTINQTTMLKCL